MQTKDVFQGTRSVPQITLLNVEKLNRTYFIKVFSITLDLKYRLCSIIAKTQFEFGATFEVELEISLFFVI